MAGHPVMQHVDVDSLFVQESTSIQTSESVEVLLEGSRTPLVMAWGREGGGSCARGLRPHSINLAIRNRGFVAFLYNAVDWLGHSNEALVQQQTLPGGMLVFNVGTGRSEARLLRPDGSTRTLLADSEGMVTFGPVDLSGLHVLELGNEDTSVLRRSVLFPAVNESDIRPSSEITLGQESVSATSGTARGYVPLWPWAIGVALLVLMLEWWIWSNRVGGDRVRAKSQAVRTA